MLRTHEIFVHFPIALFLSALLFGFVGIFYRRKTFKEVVLWNIFIGIFTVAAAIYTGFLEQETITDQAIKEIVELHRRNAYTVAALFVILFLWLVARKRKMQTREYLAWFSIMMVASTSVAYQGLIGHEISSKKQQLETQMKSPEIKKPMDYGWNF